MTERSQEQRFVLPSNVIDRLFDRLEAAYGTRWMALWGNTDLGNVKSLWAEKLGGFHDNLQAISYGLDCLDEHKHPPTLPEFLTLCRKAPKPNVPALPAPAYDHEKASAVAKEIEKIASKPKDVDISWARKPKSAMAFSSVLDLAKVERRFAVVVDQLREAGHVVGNSLVNRWNGMSWERV